MRVAVVRRIKAIIWLLVKLTHTLDFKVLLPFIARLPLVLAYSISSIRGKTNALTGRDWRSVAIGYRHVKNKSIEGYRLLPLIVTDSQLAKWRNQRFAVEAREEFEARLVAARRVPHLSCTSNPPGGEGVCNTTRKGLLLLTMHYDSFFLGAAFLARSGARINFMASAITHDPRVDRAVQDHFEAKYRGMEHYLNGGAIVNMEEGMRPFYRMLERNDTLIVLGDSPALPNSPSMTVNFLGQNRLLAGGALRLAQRTDSDIGGYLCHHRGGGNYELEVCPIGPADDPQTIQRIYDFFSAAILKNPGHWWAADLLPDMQQTT